MRIFFGVARSCVVRFNPRTRVGCERGLSLTDVLKLVSIHAPVWGANYPLDDDNPDAGFNPRTRVGCETSWTAPILLTVFQSTHPCGVRNGGYWKKGHMAQFQSTHPCGVRMLLLPHLASSERFNPRTRVGCEAPF